MNVENSQSNPNVSGQTCSKEVFDKLITYIKVMEDDSTFISLAALNVKKKNPKALVH